MKIEMLFVAPEARCDPCDAYVSLDAQDSPHWNAALIDEAQALLVEIDKYLGAEGWSH